MTVAGAVGYRRRFLVASLHAGHDAVRIRDTDMSDELTSMADPMIPEACRPLGAKLNRR
jgi:hypothetical protein